MTPPLGGDNAIRIGLVTTMTESVPVALMRWRKRVDRTDDAVDSAWKTPPNSRRESLRANTNVSLEKHFSCTVPSCCYHLIKLLLVHD
ncbi:hypothetical protein MUK42_36953 [Musa troglodytarum]|uniref:Uncharacterized protein n=1 Tax=Musa troglodytarum TaxID=320322 RepID=A0A9E7KDK2_9LILI|nr:hypothetical protein MUK42_36953 [Musa troglodytarum]